MNRWLSPELLAGSGAHSADAAAWPASPPRRADSGDARSGRTAFSARPRPQVDGPAAHPRSAIGRGHRSQLLALLTLTALISVVTSFGFALWRGDSTADALLTRLQATVSGAVAVVTGSDEEEPAPIRSAAAGKPEIDPAYAAVMEVAELQRSNRLLLERLARVEAALAARNAPQATPDSER